MAAASTANDVMQLVVVHLPQDVSAIVVSMPQQMTSTMTTMMMMMIMNITVC